MTRGSVAAVCVSDEKGTPKRDVGSRRLIANHGLEGDAHAGDWHRQVSLLSLEKRDAFNAAGGGAGDGDFGENILVAGVDPAALPVGTRLRIGEAELEVTQIGKECHAHCEIHRRVGDCIMPREGTFARVLTGGAVARGDAVEVLS